MLYLLKGHLNSETKIIQIVKFSVLLFFRFPRVVIKCQEEVHEDSFSLEVISCGNNTIDSKHI